MTTVNLSQNTPEWKEWRKTKIGASEIPIILGVSKWSTPYLLWQRKLGFLPEQSDNPAMKRGRELESTALQLVNHRLGTNYKPAIMVHKGIEWASSSLDGIDLKEGSILEIKCPNKVDHALAKEGEIPKHYYPQIQWQLYVSGLDVCVYASYHNEEVVLAYIPIDNNYINNTLLPAATDFHRCLTEMIEPELSEDDFVQINDEEFSMYAEEWKTAAGLAKLYADKEKYFKDKLISFTDDGNCQGHGVKLKRISREGSIEWKRLWDRLVEDFPEVKNVISPDNFKKKSIGYWKVTNEDKNI